ncbi:MAG: ABC transporter ATP-binding protein/permease [Oscillospiraceae bacterium]|nr:ABC transporter ATP-binding protein/permease [Oscillospiraceae bacterium]
MDENSASRFSPGAWKRSLPYVKKYRKTAAMIVGFMLLSSIGEAVYPLFTSYAVNHFITPGTTEGILRFVLGFFAVLLIGGFGVIIYCRNALVLEIRLGQELKRDCFRRLQELSLDYYSSHSVGNLLSRVMSDTDRISGVIAWGIINFLWHLCYILAAFISMLLLNPRYALLLLLLIPLVGFFTWLFQKKLLVLNRRVRVINSRITGAYNEGITGAKASKTLVIEESNCKDFGVFTSEMYRRSVHRSQLAAVLMPLVMLFGYLAVAGILHTGGRDVMSGLVNYGVLSAFISYAVSIINPIVETTAVINDLNTAQACMERVNDLIGEACTITDTPEVEARYGDCFRPKTENWEPIQGEITFDHVWFRYPGSEEYILEDFNLHIPAGTTVALVGETGAGKSTLVNLVCRFYEPTRGRILIDGRDSRERSQLWLHSSLGYVLQDPHLFSGSLADNIRYGRLDADDEAIRQAAELVSADRVAARLPGGYDEPVGESGDRLSTGEKQLVSFARALLANPAIFVLDEATSSIDTETEALIQKAIGRILEGRTSFIIAHRLSTIRHADLILVVDDGRILERGTHEELLALSGRYAALCEAMRIREEEDKSP